MKETNLEVVKNHWKKLEELHLTHQYVYPGKMADPAVETQDPGKHLREAGLLQKYLPKRCGEILLDYGCGDGKMFKYVKEYYKKYPSLIVGVDPDYTWLNKARERLLSNGGVGVFLNTTLENKVFSHEDLRNSLFCALCIQVLGHISSSSLDQVLGMFHHLLEPRGTLIIAIPIVNNEFNFPKWGKRDDLFHLVNLALDSKHPKFRIALDKNKFDYIAEYPQKNLLPVRSFFLKEKIEIGHVCGKGKVESTSIGRVFKKYKFIIKNVEIYSKHERGVGDLMMEVIRPR